MYKIIPVKSNNNSLRKRKINWWIYNVIDNKTKKKVSGPYYSKMEAQLALDSILNK
jgi:hypothetical protein